MIYRYLVFGAAAVALSVSGAYAEDYAGGAVRSFPSSSGEILVGADDMTLYTFDKDTAGVSTCDGLCAVNWPPVIAASGAAADGDYTLVARAGGAQQWAYNGKPLYFYKDDKVAGDMTGDGQGGVWHIAR